MATRPPLNVSLTPELVDSMGARGRSGQYRSASEVVRAALRLLQREELAKDRPARDGARQGRRTPTFDG